MAEKFNIEKLYARMAGYCQAMDWKDALSALSFARDSHGSQFRKGGQPYIVHPLTIAAHSASLGLRDERIMAAALLHDVVEDCGVEAEDLPVSDPEIKQIVRLLTHDKGEPLEIYYRRISGSQAASIVKILDRCDNVSTMAGVFSPEKIRSYIDETRTYVLPLIVSTKRRWPMFSDQLFVLKHHILSVIDGLEYCLGESAPAEGPQEPAERPDPGFLPLLYHIATESRIARIREIGLAPLIGERSLEAGEDVPMIYFFDTPDDAENGLYNWLGDGLDEEEELYMIVARLPVEYRRYLAKTADWETACSVPVPASMLEIAELDAWLEDWHGKQG